MSNIPLARDLVAEVLNNYRLATGARQRLQQALDNMTRTSPVKRAAQQNVRITPSMRREIKRLAAMNVSLHAIATIVGLRNGGRVSEVLNGKR